MYVEDRECDSLFHPCIPSVYIVQYLTYLQSRHSKNTLWEDIFEHLPRLGLGALQQGTEAP